MQDGAAALPAAQPLGSTSVGLEVFVFPLLRLYQPLCEGQRALASPCWNVVGAKILITDCSLASLEHFYS